MPMSLRTRPTNIVIFDYIQTVHKQRPQAKVPNYIQFINIPNADCTPNTNIVITNILLLSTSGGHLRVPDCPQIVIPLDINSRIPDFLWDILNIEFSIINWTILLWIPVYLREYAILYFISIVI